jgi:hypothetical protein
MRLGQPPPPAYPPRFLTGMGYSGLAPDAFTTFSHFLISVLI